MNTVIVSPKYQVVIPKNIRSSMKLRPGQKLKVIGYDGRIELIPDRDISELKGFVREIDPDFEREIVEHLIRADTKQCQKDRAFRVFCGGKA